MPLHDEYDFKRDGHTTKNIILMLLVVGGIIIVGIVALVITVALSIQYFGMIP